MAEILRDVLVGGVAADLTGSGGGSDARAMDDHRSTSEDRGGTHRRPAHTGASRCGGTRSASRSPDPALARRPRRRRGRGRRRLHRAVDRPLAGRGRPLACGSPCSSERWPDSAPPGRNGGWCSALFAATDARIAREHGAGAALGHAPGHAGRRSTRWAGRRRRGDRLPLRQGRHRGGRPQPGPGGPGPGRGAARPERTAPTRRPALAGGGRGPAAAGGRTGSSAPPTRRTAPPSSRPCSPGGWPRAVERRGVALYEGRRCWPSRRADRDRGRGRRPAPEVRTARGTVTADVVVRALEGWTPTLPGSTAGAGAGVLADDRHRAAGRVVLGRGRAARTARPSRTTAT